MGREDKKEHLKQNGRKKRKKAEEEEPGLGAAGAIPGAAGGSFLGGVAEEWLVVDSLWCSQ